MQEALALAVVTFALAGCAVEVGPPPESDPPLVPQKAGALPPPPQPSEPQPWSRGLDLDSGPTRIDDSRVAQGLVASGDGAVYSSEQLTFESAYSGEAPPSEAERARERARARAAAAGQPAPPQAAAAPVEDVSTQALPPIEAPRDAAQSGARDWSRSRLPPPPKAPPIARESRRQAVAPSATTEAPGGTSEAGMSAALVAEAWNAPVGTILVQVSAVRKAESVVAEWQRLQARYPKILKPLRLVVEEARLEDRGVFYRLQAGAFGSAAGASAACGTLMEAGQDCFVVVR